MSEFFFDDSKDHAYDDDFSTPRRVFRPAVSPGKVTLTSRLPPRASPSADASYQRSARSGDASAHPVQRKSAAPSGLPQATSDWMNVAVRPDLHAAPAPIQRKQQGEQDEEMSVPSSGGGAKLPEDVQAQMEVAFGTDFSAVRIHEGSQAAAVGARAYTQGTDIHFQPGQYNPQSQRGRELLGHELTHVVQQSQGRVQATTQAKGVGINDDLSLEREADELGAKVSKADGATCASCGQSLGATGCIRCKGAENHTIAQRRRLQDVPAAPSGLVQRKASTPSEQGDIGESAQRRRAEQTALDAAIGALRGSGVAAAGSIGSKAAARERVSAVAQVSDTLAAIRDGMTERGSGAQAREGSGERGAVDAEKPDGILAALEQLTRGLQGAPATAGGEASSSVALKQGEPTNPADVKQAEKEETAERGGPEGVVQRQTASGGGPDPCDSLLQMIIELVNELKRRAQDLLDDRHGLQWNHWSKSNPHPNGYGTVEGHQEQFQNKQRRLRRKLNEWNTDNCGNGRRLPTDAWRWAWNRTPQPIPRPNPAVERTVRTVGTGVAVGVGLYAAYRVIRFVPSLFPPLWWTIPINAAAP